MNEDRVGKLPCGACGAWVHYLTEDTHPGGGSLCCMCAQTIEMAIYASQRPTPEEEARDE
jgi:hypothetical protein